MWLEEQLLGGGQGSALNRGPQLGFHNDISGGQAEPSTVQMGKLRRELFQCLRREGASHQQLRAIHLSQKDTRTWSRSALSAVTPCLDGTQERKAAGSPGPRAPSTLGKPEGHPPPPQLLGGGGWVQALARLPAFPRSCACERLVLAPALFSLPGGSSGDRAGRKAAEGTGSSGSRVQGEVRSFSPRPGARPGEGPQPPCSVDMKRTLSWSCSW